MKVITRNAAHIFLWKDVLKIKKIKMMKKRMCPTDESVFLTRVTGPAGSYPSTHWACGRITQIIHINNNELRIIWLSPGVFRF